jgi:hypothetical protein
MMSSMNEIDHSDAVDGPVVSESGRTVRRKSVTVA